MSHSQPTNESELMLYRVLQRANLLQYYDTFISQGGDDVQQLCEAGEEEFLEIMALVGMASKPLHVRRLQKALQDWVTNPSVYTAGFSSAAPTIASGSILATAQKALGMNHSAAVMAASSAAAAIVNATTWTPSPSSTSVKVEPSGHQSHTVTRQISPSIKPSSTPSINGSFGNRSVSPANSDNSNSRELSTSPTPTKDSNGNATLTESQIQSIALAAEELCKTLSEYEPKPLNMKKQINQEIAEVMAMPFDAPNRMAMLRRYAAIYGRFDSKRKNEKPMSLHEISVNEAAAQICWYRASLLTRRVDLFPLARQVVQDSGYQYSKGHSSHNLSRSMISMSEGGSSKGFDGPPMKRMRLDNSYDSAKSAKDISRLNDITQEVTAITVDMEELKARIEDAKSCDDFDSVQTLQTDLEKLIARQLELMTEQSEIAKRQKRKKYRLKEKASNSDGIDDDDDYDQVMVDLETSGLDDSRSSVPDSSNQNSIIEMPPTFSPVTKTSGQKKEPKSDEHYQQMLHNLMMEFNIPDGICTLERDGEKLEATCFVCDQRFLVGSGHKNMKNLKRHLERKSHLNNLERHISAGNVGLPASLYDPAEHAQTPVACDTTTGGDSSGSENDNGEEKVNQVFAKINKRFKNVFQLWKEPEWSLSTIECTICQTTLSLFPPGGSAMEHALKHVSNKSHKAKAKQERALQKQHSKSGF